MNTWSSCLGCPWLPTLLRNVWMRLSPFCDRWESASSTTSTTGSFWPSQRQFQHRTRPFSSATSIAWDSRSTLPRAYCHPANECHSWGQLSSADQGSSTIKVYEAPIVAFHGPIAEQSVGRNSAVVQFIRGARRINPPCPRTVPPWCLPTVPRALKGPPYEPLQFTCLRSLSFKIALLLALVSVKRVGDQQALSINPACLEFGPNDSKVILKPWLVYVPKMLSTLFRAQVIALSALSVLSPSTDDQKFPLLCPVRALRVYIEHSASYRRSEQHFVSFGKRAKGRHVTKQIISSWLVDAITLAYSSLGLQCPIGV